MRRVPTVLACLTMVVSLAPAARAATSCGAPGEQWKRARAEAVQLDEQKLEEALDWARPRNSQEIAVYRHGCLVGERRWFVEDSTFQSYSMAKSVTAMAVGRAVSLGLLSEDDPIGTYVPRADPEHSRITVRDLLTMTSGLHWNFFRDYNVFTPRDRVEDALSLPFDHEPGSYFEYAQSSVTLLAYVVGQAVGEDFQAFVQRELFGPIGIDRADWTWERDNAGNTMGFYGLHMRVDDFARLGYLMLHDGMWDGRRLIDTSFVEGAVAPTRTNPAYGYLFWLNGAKRHIAPTVYSRDVRNERQIRSAPNDMYFMAGLQDQRVYVIPGLDLLIVRVGGVGSREPDTRSSVFTSASGEFEHEWFRRLMAAVEDAQVRDPGSYEYSDPVPELDPQYGILKSAQEPEHIVAGAGGP
ncbi:MAG: serine hydrolase domain-containing protein [Actinomycetota bacterium]